MPQNTGSLVLPANSHRAVLHNDANGPLLQSAPRWLTSALDLPHQFPLGPSLPPDHPLRPLLSLGRHLFHAGHPVQDLCIEFQLQNGDLMAVLAQGHLDGQNALLDLQDVTEVVRTRRKAAAIGAFHGLLGQSLPMLEVFHKIATYAPTEAPVIITGETGTGKELVARALHERSKRAKAAFVAVNCNALTAELFESELFGHERGSFTGAHRQHRGRFERAHGGTLFLDEIGDMPPFTQAKMLRALEEGVIERIGSEHEQEVDVRVIAATNVALEQAVQQRRFRADLYHRLSVLRIHVPALRERQGDLPMLVDLFVAQFARRYDKPVRRLTPEALKVLEEYHWPGNVRELRNVIERLVIESAADVIGARALSRWMEEREYLIPGEWNADAFYAPRSPIIAAAAPNNSTPTAEEAMQGLPRAGEPFWGTATPAYADPRRVLPPAESVIEARAIPVSDHRPPPQPPRELTRESIEQAFAREHGNATRAAASLGVHKATLYRQMKKLGLTRQAMEGGSHDDRQDY